MRFEHILQVYWSKGFFFGGKLFYTNKLTYTNMVSAHLYGLNTCFKYLLTKRLEISTFTLFFKNIYYFQTYMHYSSKNFIKVINIILSQINNVNLNLLQLKKLHIIRKYLIKSYSGYCHAVGKPVRGQRTWSNSWTSFKRNSVLRDFINYTKKLHTKSHTPSTKVDYRSVKKKYVTRVGSPKVSKTKYSLNPHFLTHKSWY